MGPPVNELTNALLSRPVSISRIEGRFAVVLGSFLLSAYHPAARRAAHPRRGPRVVVGISPSHKLRLGEENPALVKNRFLLYFSRLGKNRHPPDVACCRNQAVATASWAKPSKISVASVTPGSAWLSIPLIGSVTYSRQARPVRAGVVWPTVKADGETLIL